MGILKVIQLLDLHLFSCISKNIRWMKIGGEERKKVDELGGNGGGMGA